MGEQIERNKQEEMEIDLLEIARLLWRKAWIIILCLVAGAGTVSYTHLTLPTN